MTEHTLTLGCALFASFTCLSGIVYGWWTRGKHETRLRGPRLGIDDLLREQKPFKKPLRNSFGGIRSPYQPRNLR